MSVVDRLRPHTSIDDVGEEPVRFHEHIAPFPVLPEKKHAGGFESKEFELYGQGRVVVELHNTDLENPLVEYGTKYLLEIPSDDLYEIGVHILLGDPPKFDQNIGCMLSVIVNDVEQKFLSLNQNEIESAGSASYCYWRPIHGDENNPQVGYPHDLIVSSKTDTTKSMLVSFIRVPESIMGDIEEHNRS